MTTEFMRDDGCGADDIHLPEGEDVSEAFHMGYHVGLQLQITLVLYADRARWKLVGTLLL